MPLFTRQHSRQPPSTFEKDHPAVDIESGVQSDTAPITSLETKDEVLDPNIVWWDGPNNLENPRNWSNIQKYTNVALVSIISEVYGRLPVYYTCNVLFTIFSVACAVSSNLGMLIGFRLLAGCAGSASISNGGGTISDLIIQEKRGASLSLYAMGPVAGGYLSLAKGRRWNFWVIAIAVSTF
jgi:hypothetical protein